MMLAWGGLRHRYAGGAEVAYADFLLPAGRHLLLRGASGSGKSTLLALLAGLLRVQHGLLSVGQAQRVALARALMRRPRLLLADEPSASLDDEHALHMLALLLTTAEREGCTLIIASHDGRVIDALGDRDDVTELVLRGPAGSPVEDRTTYTSEEGLA